MTRRNPHTSEIARLFQSLEEELNELESSYNLQFDTTASLQDKLAASKRARLALRESRRLRELIAESLLETED
jgi:hypothetical protein